ncbi:cation:proton antiporter [Lentilactobacillus farraginis]|uniref:CPA1 family monovalent cation proton (H+) antiporter-1 n=2 Tax=Lentilactobacillus farraginis DSM 18382 = JCM 14108 TaxID=1423743 RepID=A0A0R1VGT2_9LACO|nr:sodium:proton antiporter [Lentilactobacillus farraginis]KRM04642.1 CPA1 family monovalent cation proton (H+) antiporter-1 [Lentilactobacillus farraginis DSM 18382 = JCM 14108]
MDAFYLVALLIVATIVSNMIYTVFPKIPLTFYQIGCGFLLTLLPIFRNYSLYPEFFMVGIIAPLMFNDGRNTNVSHLGHAFGLVISMAVYLAIFTATAIGIFAHTMMTLIPLSLCFALAAIVTPTDSLAFSSITENVQLPENVAGTLESESLFNDASGIVVFNLALSSFLTGQFSFSKGLVNFLISFFGGLLIGLIAGLIFVKLQTFLVNKSMDTTSVIVPFSLMTPFAIYLLSEHLGCSGILAVVAAGIVYGLNQSRLKLTTTNVRLVTGATWAIVSNLLNGIVFVLLGVTLPTVISNIIPLSTTLILELGGLALAIYLLMGLIRFCWAKFNFVKLHRKKAPSLKEAFLIAIGGVHGTITLSMALSLPLSFSGHAFPYRNQLIFVAAIVILLSLIVPALILPQILPTKTNGDQASFNHYRTEMVNYSIAKIKAQESIPLADRNYVIDMLASQKQGQNADKEQINTILNQTRKVEIDAITNLLAAGKIPQSVANRISRRMVMTPDRRGSFLTKLRFLFRVRFPSRKTRRIKRNVQSVADRFDPDLNSKLAEQKKAVRKLLEETIYKQVNAYLDDIETGENTTAVAFVRNGYNFRHARLDTNDNSDDLRNQLLIQAFQYEYSYVATAFKNQQISRSLSDQLNQSITTDQMFYMEQE